MQQWKLRSLWRGLDANALTLLRLRRVTARENLARGFVVTLGARLRRGGERRAERVNAVTTEMEKSLLTEIQHELGAKLQPGAA
ncbi:MAG: hypothetical protein L0338_33465, partial [Acidobacteria bacterium]|nr:hypothetical protein [Acidobacteriota bacterium]